MFGKRRHDRLFLREAQRLHQEVVGQADRPPVLRLKLENQGTRRMLPGVSMTPASRAMGSSLAWLTRLGLPLPAR